jgi:hypothetical protein
VFEFFSRRVSDFKATRPPAPAHFCSEIQTILFGGGGNSEEKILLIFHFETKSMGQTKKKEKEKRRIMK